VLVIIYIFPPRQISAPWSDPWHTVSLHPSLLKKDPHNIPKQSPARQATPAFAQYHARQKADISHNPTEKHSGKHEQLQAHGATAKLTTDRTIPLYGQVCRVNECAKSHAVLQQECIC